MNRLSLVRRRLPGLAVLLVLIAGAVPSPDLAAQQVKPPEIRLLFSDRPNVYTESEAVLIEPGTEKNPEPILRLRPNTQSSVYLFAENTTAAERDVRVQLLAGDKVVAEGPAKLAAKGTGRVTLAPTTPVKPAPGKEKDEAKLPDAAWIAGQGAAPQFRFRILDKSNPPDLLVGLQVPEDYTIPGCRYDAAVDKKQLTVTVTKGTTTFRGDVCPVKVDVTLTNPKDGKSAPLGKPKAGVVARTLPRGTEPAAVELSVIDPRLAGQTADVHVTIDGYARAYHFLGQLTGQGGQINPARPARDIGVYLESGQARAEGEGHVLRLGLDNVSPERLDDYTLQVDLGARSSDGDKFDVFHGETLTGHRFQQVFVNPQTPEGAIAFKTVVHDWEVTLPTQGITGKRDIRVMVKKADKTVTITGSPTGTVYRPLFLDGSPPTITLFDAEKPQLVRGQPLTVEAAGSAESGIKQVVFFLGRPTADPKAPGGHKIPDNAVQEKGAEKTDTPGVWTASLLVPSDKPGVLDIGVLFVSNAGLVEFGTRKVVLVDEGAGGAGAGGKPGKIEGKVVEGDRPQAEIEVALRDGMGAVKATATTNKEGKFEFKDVPPGPYKVTAAKSKSATRGETSAQVEAGKTTKDVTVKLTR